VRHLDVWYAQAIRMKTCGDLRGLAHARFDLGRRYKGWPVLKKLQYVEGLMQGLAAVPPKVVTREEIDPLPDLKKTLTEHYARKRAHYGRTARPFTIRT